MANRSRWFLTSRAHVHTPARCQQLPCSLQFLRQAWLRLLHGFAGGMPAPSQVLAVALQRRSLLHRCVQEALRLRGAGVTVRMAMSDLELPRGEGQTLLVHKVSRSAPAGM